MPFVGIPNHLVFTIMQTLRQPDDSVAGMAEEVGYIFMNKVVHYDVGAC